MARAEFTASIKRKAFQRSGGVCEVHRLPHALGLPETCDGVAKELDHIMPCILGGEATLDNSAYLCKACHRAKTDLDVADKSKRNRHRVRDDRPKPGWFQKGRKLQSRGFDKTHTKRMDGTVIKRKGVRG